MIIPRFTIRTLLVMLTVCACLLVIVGMAFRGQHWAWGVTIGMLSLVIIALVHAAWFGLIWMFARPKSPRPKPAPKLD
ncbi:MAG TPA: hypothetical protein VFW73_02215 [Lacipirellulaceae bacterium]|nr:hypothetical protein [Lacipirellulaceae bacterium]